MEIKKGLSFYIGCWINLYTYFKFVYIDSRIVMFVSALNLTKSSKSYGACCVKSII